MSPRRHTRHAGWIKRRGRPPTGYLTDDDAVRLWPRRSLRHKRTPSGISPEHLALGRTIREIRALRRLSQEELGFRAKAHRNYVGAVERGEVNPTFRTLMRISAGLDVPLSSLIRLYERRTHRASN